MRTRVSAGPYCEGLCRAGDAERRHVMPSVATPFIDLAECRK